VRLHVHEWGPADGRPVVCLHGVTSHGARFRALAGSFLAERRVVAFDLRGHGRSGYEPPWDLDTHAADALETAAALGVERADWIGHSFGGRLVAEIAARRPEAMRSATLLDPALSLPAAVCLERAELERADESFASIEDAIEDRVADDTLFFTPREYLEQEMADHLEPREDGRLRYRYCPSAAVVAWSEMATAAPPVGEVPTLMLIGERSWIPLEAHAERYRAALGDRFRAVTVRGGHTVLWDALEQAGAEIGEFLSAGVP
jgi:lipase